MSCPSARRPATTSPSRSLFQATTALCSKARQEKVFTWSWKLRPRTAPSLPKNRKRDSACERRALALVQLLPDAASVRGVVQEAEHKGGLPHPPDLGQCLVQAVLARVRAEPVQDERGRGGTRAHGGDQAHHPVPSGADQVRFDRP